MYLNPTLPLIVPASVITFSSRKEKLLGTSTFEFLHFSKCLVLTWRKVHLLWIFMFQAQVCSTSTILEESNST